MARLSSLVSKVLRRHPKKEREAEVFETRKALATRDICSDISIDIVPVTEEIECKVLTPIHYMNIRLDPYYVAIQDSKRDPWDIAIGYTLGICQDEAGRAFKAVLKQTGEVIGFGNFICIDQINDPRGDIHEAQMLERKGTKGELHRWWEKELDKFREQHLGGTNHVRKFTYTNEMMAHSNTIRMDGA
jgi:hypothetical protein